MSNINANITDYLKQIESLTSTNLQILKTINDSFFTKKSHLYTEIDNETFSGFALQKMILPEGLLEL